MNLKFPTNYRYTNSLVTAFANQGTPIKFLQVCVPHVSPVLAYFSLFQIGNEINSGILWPVAEISVAGYSPLSQLLHSAANGAHDASSTVQVVVHLANGWDESAVASFYEQIFIAGEFAETDFDVMGFSFYPFYDADATYAALLASLNNMVAKYDKVRHQLFVYGSYISQIEQDILIVETGLHSCLDLMLKSHTLE